MGPSETCGCRVQRERSPRSGRGGFSLIELAVAALVILILTGIAVWMGTGSSAAAGLDAACRQLLADIRRTQELASSLNRSCGLTLEAGIAGEDGYRIREKGAAEAREVVPLPAGVRFDSSDLGKALWFDRLGGTAPTTTLRVAAGVPNPYYLVLTSWDGQTSRKIEVHAGTGLARVP